MRFNLDHLVNGSLSKLFIIILITMTIPVFSCAEESEKSVIFDGPFFENYGQGFRNWTGDSPVPSGTLLLKGGLTISPEEVAPGDEVECILDLSVSAMTLIGKEGAVLKDTSESRWSVSSSKLLGKFIDFPVIPDTELLGIGIGSTIPDLINRDTKRITTITIPDTAEPGVYQMRAIVNGTNLRTKQVNLTIMNQSGEMVLNNTSTAVTVMPTITPTPITTSIKNTSESDDDTDPRYVGMSEKIKNERNLHVNSIYPYSGGAGNTMGIKIYGDHFTAPVYVTLVKGDTAIEGYNYCFEENQKYGVAMIDIPTDTELGIWNLVVTTKDGKSTIPFEVTEKLIEPEIISIDAPILTPDEGKDITITGKQMLEPCEILLAGEELNWFSFSPKPVLMHNTLKIRVKINAPLSEEVTSGQLDLCLWNGDGVVTTYEKAVAFSTEDNK